MKTLLTFTCLFFVVFTVSGQNVGINTPMPDADLHVNGEVKITDGTQGDGKVLTSNAAGLASWQGPRTYLTLASDASIASNTYVGLGSSSSSFVRNSIVVPFNGVITSLIFSVRQSGIPTVSCEIYKASGGFIPVATGILATVILTGPGYAVATANVPVNQGDLISVRVSGNLSEGAAATIGIQ